ncbi:MAG: hypothetical protein AAF358_00430 [Pseudomonadota bacterium]
MNLFTLLNPVIGIAGLLALTLSATIAFAEVRETLKIKVKTDDGISETVTIENLAEGQSEVFTTESGNEVLVTRHPDGLEMEVGGRVIDVKLPNVMAHSEGAHGSHVFLSDGEALLDGENVWIEHGDKEIKVINSSAHRVVIDTQGDSLSEEEITALIHEHTEGMDIQVDVESALDGDGDQEVIIIKKHVVTVEDDNEE